MLVLNNIDLESSRIPSKPWEDGTLHVNTPVGWVYGVYLACPYNRIEKTLIGMGYIYKIRYNGEDHFTKEVGETIKAYRVDELLQGAIK